MLRQLISFEIPVQTGDWAAPSHIDSMENNKFKYIFVAFIFFALFAGYLARTFSVPEEEKRYFNYDDDDGTRTVAKHRQSGPFGQGSRTLKGRNKKSHWSDFSSADKILEDAEKEIEKIQMAKVQEHMDDVGDDAYADFEVEGKYVDSDGNEYSPDDHSLSSMNSDARMRALVKEPKKPMARGVFNRSKNKPNYSEYDEPPRDQYEDRFQYGPWINQNCYILC